MAYYTMIKIAGKKKQTCQGHSMAIARKASRAFEKGANFFSDFLVVTYIL